MVILSSHSKESLTDLLNRYFYSTTYRIDSKGEITFKDGEPVTHLTYKVKGKRHQISRT